jgi:hypothetical protein
MTMIRRLPFVCENAFIVPADSLKEALSSGLQDFLRQSIEAKSVDLAKLTDMLGQLPTQTEDILGDRRTRRQCKFPFPSISTVFAVRHAQS